MKLPGAGILSRPKMPGIPPGAPRSACRPSGREIGPVRKKSETAAGCGGPCPGAAGLLFSPSVYKHFRFTAAVSGRAAFANTQPKVFSWTLTVVGPERPCGACAAT